MKEKNTQNESNKTIKDTNTIKSILLVYYIRIRAKK